MSNEFAKRPPGIQIQQRPDLILSETDKPWVPVEVELLGINSIGNEDKLWMSDHFFVSTVFHRK